MPSKKSSRHRAAPVLDGRSWWAVSVKEAQARAWAVADGLLVPFNFFLPQLNEIINKYSAGKQGGHSAERITIINSIINDQGYPLHDVATTIYLLRKFGLANQAESQIAADIVHARAAITHFSI